MNKISITIALLLLVIAYVGWHVAHRLPNKMNTRDNLMVISDEDAKTPFLWLREHSVIENGQMVLLDSKKECFSLYELTSLFSAKKDVELLQKFCESDVELGGSGYKVLASCRNGSATFYVDVHFKVHHAKWQEWQQNILDMSHNLVRQEKIIFQQQGECHVSSN